MNVHAWICMMNVHACSECCCAATLRSTNEVQHFTVTNIQTRIEALLASSYPGVGVLCFMAESSLPHLARSNVVTRTRHHPSTSLPNGQKNHSYWIFIFATSSLLNIPYYPFAVWKRGETYRGTLQHQPQRFNVGKTALGRPDRKFQINPDRFFNPDRQSITLALFSIAEFTPSPKS